MIDDKDAGAILAQMVRTSRTFRIAGKQSTLTGTKFGFLQHLRHGDARLSELAQEFFVSAAVASRAVDSLEADGMVERRTDPQDARAFLISITERGRVQIAEGESRAVRRFAEALADWSPEDAGQAIRILERLNVHLHEVLHAPGSPEAVQADILATTDGGSEIDR